MLQVLVNVFLKKFSNYRKRYLAMQKEKYRKNGQVSKYLKQWILRCPLKKEEKEKKKKIAHTL
jgi:hypothetical protein